MVVCGVGGCPNVLVSSEAPPSWGREPYSPQLLGWITMHELGHALGLGHATNLLESTDLMG
jgi:predicted Zn-dependent protease